MHAQPNRDRSVDPEEHELYVDRTILGLLLDCHPGLVTEDDLRRTLIEASQSREITEPDLADGMARLIACGLAVRVDRRLLLASSCAVRSRDLLSDSIDGRG